MRYEDYKAENRTTVTELKRIRESAYKKADSFSIPYSGITVIDESDEKSVHAYASNHLSISINNDDSQKG